MKKTFIALTAAVSIFALSACSNGNSEVIVKTKAGNITKEEFYNALKDRYGDQILQELVYGKVLDEEIKISDKEVNDKLKEIKDQLGEGFEFQMQQAGFKTEEQFKKTLKVALLQEKAAAKDIKVTEKEMKDYYKNLKPEIKASHILVEDEKTAKEVLAKLDKGAKFEALAKEYSKDTGSAEKGGDLGWFGAGKMVPEFEEAAYKLKVGEISNPVKSQFGYHIIKLTDKKKLKSYDEMKEEIKSEVKRSKIDQTKIDKAVQKIIDKADVDVKDKEFKDLFKKEEK